jgi:hypothetical protein
VVPSSPVQAFDLTVWLDYGQFWLVGVQQPDADADPTMRLIEEATSDQGIASTGATSSWS